MNTISENILYKNHIDLVEIDEVFTQIPNWNRYFISNHGRLIHKNSKGKIYIVKPSETEDKYLTYTLSKPARLYNGEKVKDKNGKPKRNSLCKPAHTLVAMMYVQNHYNYTIKPVVHHKDKDRQNNYFKNLMYASTPHHGIIHTINKIAYYNQDTATYHTYKDIELLANRLDTDTLELLDTIGYTDKLFQDGKWSVYKVNDSFIGVIFNKDSKGVNTSNIA